VNTGDWVESGTAVGETADGKLEMIRWMDVSGQEQDIIEPPRNITEAA